MTAEGRNGPGRYHIAGRAVSTLTEPYSAATIHDRRQPTMTDQTILTAIERLGDRLDRRLDGLDGRLAGMDERLNAVDGRLAALFDAVTALRHDFDIHYHGPAA